MLWTKVQLLSVNPRQRRRHRDMLSQLDGLILHSPLTGQCLQMWPLNGSAKKGYVFNRSHVASSVKGVIFPNVPLCECMLKSKCQGNWGGVSESYSLTEQQACPETPMFLFQNAIFSPGHVHLIVITLWPDTLFCGDGLGLFSSGLERYYPQLNRRLNIWLTVSLNQLNYSF